MRNSENDYTRPSPFDADGPSSAPPTGSGAPRETGSWEREVIEKLLLEVYRERRNRRAWRWLIAIVVAVAVAGAMLSKETADALGEHTAVVRLQGVIAANNDTATNLIAGLEQAYASKGVKAILIDANSPGGSPVESDIAYEEIMRLKKAHPKVPLYAVAGDVCASGCYYIVSAADKIYANPSSIVGSIGVIYSNFGFTGLMDKWGVERRLKTAGRNKGMGDPFSPETEEANAVINKLLQDSHSVFIDRVKAGRKDRLKWQGNDQIFSGRIYSGIEGKEVGLIDDFGSLQSVARDVAKAEKLVDYTAIDYRSRLLRSLGSEFKGALRETFEQGGELR